jgi:hypothetical protein
MNVNDMKLNESVNFNFSFTETSLHWCGSDCWCGMPNLHSSWTGRLQISKVILSHFNSFICNIGSWFSYFYFFLRPQARFDLPEPVQVPEEPAVSASSYVGEGFAQRHFLF